MRKSIVSLVCSLAFVLGVAGYSSAEEIVTGVIIEQSGDKKFIQVNDAVYLVESVWSDDGEHAVAQVSIDSLSEGDVVQVYPGEKEVDFWTTEQVVQLEGVKKQEAIEELELETEIEQISGSASDVSPSSSGESNSSSGQMKLENGVWVN